MALLFSLAFNKQKAVVVWRWDDLLYLYTIKQQQSAAVDLYKNDCHTHKDRAKSGKILILNRGASFYIHFGIFCTQGFLGMLNPILKWVFWFFASLTSFLEVKHPQLDMKVKYHSYRITIYYHMLVLQKMVVSHIKLFSRKMRFRKSLFWQLPVLIMSS